MCKMDCKENDLSTIGTDSCEKERNVRGFQLRFAIEIPLILLLLGTTMTPAPLSNLIMYRACVHPLGHPVDTCRSFLEPSSNDHSRELEEEVQRYTTSVTTCKAVLEGLGPAILALFVGVWSDNHGRKPLLIVPMAGVMLGSLLTVVYSFLEGFGPWWALVIAIPITMTGAATIIIIGMLCYINDITTRENRSMRLVLTQVSVVLATTSGGLASPYLVQAIGTMYLFLLITSLQAIATIFTIFVIRESKQDVTPGRVLDVFNISNAKEIVVTCFKKKHNYGRAVVLICVLTTSLASFTVYGGQTLVYLYARNRIGWTLMDFATYSAVSNAMWFAGSLFGVGVIQRLTKISDLKFVAISFFSSVIEFIVKTIATTTWQMYVGSTISLFGFISSPLIRSFLTKNIARTDIAKVFCFMGATEAFLPLLSPILYNALYSATISVFPQSIMVLTSVVNGICFLLVLVVTYLSKKKNSMEPYKAYAE